MSYKTLAPAIGALLAFAIGGSAGVALADGYTPRKVAYAEAQRCSGGPFDGPYIGANLGFARVETTQSSPGDPDATGDDTSFTAGGQVGYNLQCGHVVFGIEADFNHAGLETNNTVLSGGIVPVNLKDEINWFGTVRGRVGVLVHPNALLYATGGLAYADTSHKFSVPSFAFSQTDDDFKTGWTFGGGMELLRDDRWLFRAEALYVDLGDNTHSYSSTTCTGPCGGTAKWEEPFWVARIGLSYRFQREQSVPLK